MKKRQAIYEALFAQCPSDQFDRQIRDRRPNNRIRSTICHPEAALQSLQRQFSVRELVSVGVATRNRFGDLQLVPRLCQANGIVIALRKTSEEAPFDLLTARGLVGSKRHPVLSAFSDFRRAELMEATGMLLAAYRIADVAILDLLDLPATLGFGLSRLRLAECRELDAMYGEGLPGFELRELDTEGTDDDDPKEDAEAQPELNSKRLAPNASPAMRPMLVLIERLPGRNGSMSSNWLSRVARWFADVREHTGIPFAGVWIWQPDDKFQERLKFACQARERSLIRNVFLESLASLVDIEAFLQLDVEPRRLPPYVTARNDLIKQLTLGSSEFTPDVDGLNVALDAYDAAVQRELAEPLIAWSLEHANPVVRDLGTQLADVGTLLHRIAPRLQALQYQHLLPSSRGDAGTSESELLNQYMRLLDRFGRLSGEIVRWKKS